MNERKFLAFQEWRGSSGVSCHSARSMVGEVLIEVQALAPDPIAWIVAVASRSCCRFMHRLRLRTRGEHSKLLPDLSSRMKGNIK